MISVTSRGRPAATHAVDPALQAPGEVLVADGQGLPDEIGFVLVVVEHEHDRAGRGR